MDRSIGERINQESMTSGAVFDLGQVEINSSKIAQSVTAVGAATARTRVSVGVFTGAPLGLLLWAVVVFRLYCGQPKDNRISFLWASVGACLGMLVFGYAASWLHRYVVGRPIDPTETSVSAD